MIAIGILFPLPVAAGKIAAPDWKGYHPRWMENTKDLTRKVEASAELACAVLGAEAAMPLHISSAWPSSDELGRLQTDLVAFNSWGRQWSEELRETAWHWWAALPGTRM